MNNLVIICAILLLVLLFLKVPVYIAVLSASAVYFIGTPGMNLSIFAQKTISGAEGLSLLAIPFFVCAGIFMNYTGVTKRIMNCCEVLTARMPGGLAQVNILLSTLMGGLSGSSLADAAMQCKMLVPTMESKGYSKSFSTVITAASGMVVPLIPPGVGLIIYGCINNISIGKLFIAGIGPGIVLCVTLMIFTHFLSKKRGYLPSRTTKIPVSEKIAAVRPAFLPLLLPIIIIGGVRIGVFTFSQWMISNIHNKYVFLIMVNIFLLIVGMFIEGNASMIVLAPLLHPVAMAYGIDDIHFAMVYIFNCTIGAFTPPMGTLMFVSCGITKCPTKDFIKEAVPFYILFAIDIIVLTYIPQLTTFLVNVFY